ncbi:Receptor-type guanylate cyclase gcy [Seminavis robusta]|uniref:Receptor-type guanylate cyclase gcy n=1 Tax=Seminavis robusta TaxID=568900 RepID=A0A9N8H5Y6_9STRA|nr:Receptor-type guanylate cyclase gcy [Seminavis robusta]|eukprot:Sro98_g050660.1 Receptor-type guanylate cyclase gcy (797) ;mRNA; r:111131-114025
MDMSKPSQFTPDFDEDVFVDVDNESTKSADDTSEGEVSLAKDETKRVAKFRLLLFCLLVGTAVAVSLVAYILTKRGQQEDFEGNFYSHASKVIETFETEAANKRSAIVSLSRQITSHANFANETFPFVTLPDFEMRARLTLELAEVIAIMFLPLVTRENLKEWERYSVANQQWYWEGMALQERFTGHNATTTGVEHFDNHGDSDDSEGLHLSEDVLVFRESGPDEDLVYVTDEPGPFFPCWQFTPQIPVPVVNADFRTLPESKAELDAFLANDARRNMAGPTFEFEVGSGGAVFLDLLLERWQGGGNHYDGGPLAYYYIPVYDTLDRNASLVGVLDAFIYWQTYFENVLPEQAQGVVAVLDNTCNQSFTFSIHGSDAKFVGPGDLHDSKYDEMGEFTDYGIFLQRNPEARHGDTGGCFYRLSLYPSQEMEDDYITNGPWIIALSIFGVFAFTVVVFLLYDNFVEKRQRLVMKTAKQTSDVVNKLFPEAVRERLYEADGNGTDSANKHGTRLGNSALARSSLVSADSSTTGSPLANGCSPIADEYLNCTVFFADLAGFTKWSSTRTPSEVFLLLETLYGAFDKIAKRLSIFKVETIGDCYVAVTGLPRPQEDHAVIMTKFAANCIVKMNQIINSENLLLTLGDDTSTLEMRVGMHSGPVTAGVLRGEKARFQLFGDTVNTASRMESNGQKGRMQVSQTTADLLIAAGKDRWLTAREDKVEAKGKGAMQTYWVDIVSDPSVRSSVLSSSVVESHLSGDVDFLGATFPVVEESFEEDQPSTQFQQTAPVTEGYDDELEI